LERPVAQGPFPQDPCAHAGSINPATRVGCACAVPRALTIRRQNAPTAPDDDALARPPFVHKALTALAELPAVGVAVPQMTTTERAQVQWLPNRSLPDRPFDPLLVRPRRPPDPSLTSDEPVSIPTGQRV